MMQAALRVIGGKQDGKLIPLTTQKFLIGREQDCHLRPNSELVSRHHCVFSVDEFGVRLRDLGSTNGTLVNNERLRGQTLLNAGDRVQIGKLEFEIQMTESAADVPIPDLSSVIEGVSAETAELSGSETSFDLPVVTDDAPAASPDETHDTTIVSQQPAEQPPAPEPAAQPAAAGYSGYDPNAQYQPQPGYPQQPTAMYPQMPGMPYQPQMPYQGMPNPYGMPQPYPPPGMYPPQPSMYPPQPAYPQAQPSAPEPEPSYSGDEEKQAVPPVQLPDPSSTGAKAPEPKPEGEEAPKDNSGDPSHKAADIIKQYMQRRPEV